VSGNHAELTDAFESGSLSPEGFSHEDHVAVAREMLLRHDFMEASRRYAAALQHLTEKAGVPEKFNMTVTLAFMSVISERMARDEGATFSAFLEENPDLVSGDLLGRWYSRERLVSPAARSAFLMPDRDGQAGVGIASA
jgi:hypothetical protein